MYDKDFRLHLSKFPKRSWAIILQQAWTVRMREKVKFSASNDSQGSSGRRNSTEHRTE